MRGMLQGSNVANENLRCALQFSQKFSLLCQECALFSSIRLSKVYQSVPNESQHRKGEVDQLLKKWGVQLVQTH